jgi:hypothetical protein
LKAIGGRRKAEADAGASNRRGEERRREPRISLTRENAGTVPPVQIVVGDKSYRLFNLSVRGFCIFAPRPHPLVVEPGDLLDASMVTGSTRVELRVRVSYLKDNFVGCEILEAESFWHDAASSILDPIVIGKKLREIDPRFVAPDEDGNQARWFQSANACDLFVWHSSEGDLIGAQLFFMGQVVDWSLEHGVRTGMVSASSARSPKYAASELFDLDTPPSPEVMYVARRILKAAELPEDLWHFLLGDKKLGG